MVLATDCPADFSDIDESLRAKVARDILVHVTDGRWDVSKFDHHNDYQRHLYARFLRMAGVDADKVRAIIFTLSDDVAQNKRAGYAQMVVYSHIVGFKDTEHGNEIVPEVAG